MDGYFSVLFYSYRLFIILYVFVLNSGVTISYIVENFQTFKTNKKKLDIFSEELFQLPFW